MEEMLARVLDKIFSEAGMVAIILCAGVWIFFKLYMAERAERIASCDAYKSLCSTTNEILKGIHGTLESIKERL